MVSNSAFTSSHRGEPLVFGSNLVKPSELFGSVKRTLGRKTRCQCKHHQQKLLQKQEEQRQQLKRQLLERGDRRHLTAIERHNRAINSSKRSTLEKKYLLYDHFKKKPAEIMHKEKFFSRWW